MGICNLNNTMLKFSNNQLHMKKKICYIITKGNWGGGQKYVYNLATSLPKDKFETFVITGEGKILKNKLEDKGMRVYEISSLKRDMSFISEIKTFWSIFKIVQKEKPDVLHLNSPKASGIGAVVGRILLTPNIIQTAHGWSFNENRNLLSRFLIYIFSWITVALCYKTIVIAKNEKKQALSMPFIREKKVALIRNGIEEIKYIEKNIVRDALLNRISVPKESVAKETIWIGTISELHKNKGLKYVINALSKVKTPFLFFVIGEGEEREYLENLIMRNGMQKKVFLLGFIDIANLYLKAFDIFTLTSIKEGLPYTLLEAGMAGLPIISSDIGGIPDIIDDGKNGLLNRKGDEKEITKDIEYLISNPKVGAEFGKKIKVKIEKEFSIEQMLKKTINLYR